MLSNHRLAILLAFTISGCTGLIYESVWSHYLGLYLGHAAYSQTLTLGIFMGSIGSINPLFTEKPPSPPRNNPAISRPDVVNLI